MVLEAPNLDDRSFQQLVDDAKRLLQRKWPEWTGWTDHNVSDPGITLIEACAQMVDQLIYRLNRVPDRNYVKFLELVGVRLFPPNAATTRLMFSLSGAPIAEPVVVPCGTEVGTRRVDDAAPIVFATTDTLSISACRLEALVVQRNGEAPDDRTVPFLTMHQPVEVFGTPHPHIGDCFFVGLSEPAPANVVCLRFTGPKKGVGIREDAPPWRWDALVGAQRWATCPIERDSTKGFNVAGDLWLRLPDDHTAAVVAGRRAGWLRCSAVTPPAGDNPYFESPIVESLEAFAVGGVAPAANSEEIRDEVLGISEGVPGHQFRLRNRPVVLLDDPIVLEVHGARGEPEPWQRVEHFGDSSPDDHHFVLDAVAGLLTFGPALRDPNAPDGSGVRRYGAVPPAGALLKVRAYHTGGGAAGNLPAGALTVLKSAVPMIDSVVNTEPAAGGVDGETLEHAKLRAPFHLRTRERAVTLEDFEYLTRRAAPEIARVMCLAPNDDESAGVVRVVLVPAVGDAEEGGGRVDVERLRHIGDVGERVRAELDERRTVGALVVVQPAEYRGVTVVARVRCAPSARSQDVEAATRTALFRYFHPLVGGPDGQGWPFGRPVQVGEVYAVLQRVPGLDFVEEAMMFPVVEGELDPSTGRRAAQPADDPVARIDLPPSGLVFGHAHQVRAEPSPSRS